MFAAVGDGIVSRGGNRFVEEENSGWNQAGKATRWPGSAGPGVQESPLPGDDGSVPTSAVRSSRTMTTASMVGSGKVRTVGS